MESSTSERAPRRGDVLELSVDRLARRGGALGEVEGRGVRLLHAVPGSRVRAEVRRRRRGRVEAHVVEVVDPGPHSREQRCPHFVSCGGCSWQDVAYEQQLVELARMLEEELAPLRAALGEELVIAPVLGCAEPWAYRNKMDFTFGAKRWVEPHEAEDAGNRDFALGLHSPGRFDKVLDVEQCAIQFARGDAIKNSARRLAKERELEPWDARAHTGVLRHLVLREGRASGELLALLVCADRELEAVRAYALELVRLHPELTTLVLGVRSAVSAVAVGERYEVLHGPGHIHEELGGVRYEVSPTSFFQTNTAQAEQLVRLVREALSDVSGTLYDLYCGTGTFALSLAAQFERVHGFELSQEAVEDARRNAANNGIEHVDFEAGDLLLTLAPEALAERGLARPDACVVDPPRAGVQPKALSALRALAPPRLVYVSCNPKTAAEDLALLAQDGYRVLSVQPVDLFPHTPHLECVFHLVGPGAPTRVAAAAPTE